MHKYGSEISQTFSNLPKKKDPAAVKLGRKGGKEIAKREPEYLRQLQARRKQRKGGRPPKSKKSC